jgi:hypothetical protein
MSATVPSCNCARINLAFALKTTAGCMPLTGVRPSSVLVITASRCALSSGRLIFFSGPR